MDMDGKLNTTGPDNKRFFSLEGDPTIWIILVIMAVFSVIEVYSASSRLTFGSANYWAPVIQHVKHLCMGFAVMFVVHKMPYGLYKCVHIFLLPASVILLVVLMLRGGGGAQRWINLGFMTIQPSEFAKVGVVSLVAYLLSRMDVSNERSQQRCFCAILVITALICLIIMKENLSTAVILGVVVCFMMFLGNVSLRRLLTLVGTLACAVALAVVLFLSVQPEQLRSIPLMPERATTWQARVIDFCQSKEEKSPEQYALQDAPDKPQETHANIAIASSHFIGKGPGNSTERDFLQEATCDFIYAIIIEEFGLIFGGVVVIAFYILLFLRTYKTAIKCDKKYPTYFVMGGMFLIFVQAFVNMAVAVGLGPVTGQPLPFISKGGSSVLATSIIIGVILGTHRYNSERAESVTEPEED